MRLLDQGNFVIAVDVHTAGIADVVKHAAANNLNSLRVFHGDGIWLLANGIAKESIAQIHVYFPDPWPKARHNNRRLFTIEFLNLVHPLLVTNGKLLLVTDDDSYAQQAGEVVSQCTNFSEVQFTQEVTMTSFHKRAIKHGHRIHKFALIKK